MEESDYLVNLIAEALEIFKRASVPGAFLVDAIPIRTCFQVGVLSIWNDPALQSNTSPNGSLVSDFRGKLVNGRQL